MKGKGKGKRRILSGKKEGILQGRERGCFYSFGEVGRGGNGRVMGKTGKWRGKGKKER